MSRIYPLLGLLLGYGLVMWTNPIHLALRDGLRCISRFKRIWLTFALLGLGYAAFHVLTFGGTAQYSLSHLADVGSWEFPRLSEVWREVPVPAVEGVAGIFDNATSTFPLSVVAALLLLMNWRGFHGLLVTALWKRFRFLALPIYLVLLVAAFAALLKPVVFWKLPAWSGPISTAHLLQFSAITDSLAFVFEYLFGVYVQVYLITVCLAWIKGLSFREHQLFQFAVRRFSYVLKWAGLVVLVSTLLVRLPLLLAYFMNIPGVLDYLPLQRGIMSALIILFASVQVSLVLHNESLAKAIGAHFSFLKRDWYRFLWFVVIALLHYLILVTLDAMIRTAVADRTVALLIWKFVFVLLRAFVTGWLLASWVSLFRQCETGRISQESWIRY